MLKKSLAKLCTVSKCYTNSVYRSYSVYEPTYLEVIKLIIVFVRVRSSE